MSLSPCAHLFYGFVISLKDLEAALGLIPGADNFEAIEETVGAAGLERIELGHDGQEAELQLNAICVIQKECQPGDYPIVFSPEEISYEKKQMIYNFIEDYRLDVKHDWYLGASYY